MVFLNSPTTQPYIHILGRGSSRDSSSPHPGETPVVILRVRVLSCRDLEARDCSGYSDPFVIVSLSGKQFKTPVCKRNLNPVYESQYATFDFPIYTSLVHMLGTLEFVVWDEDLIKKDYMGECALPVGQWFKGTAFAFDEPNNEPISVGLVSSRRNTTVRGTMRIKLGFVHPPNSTSRPDFGDTYNALVNPLASPVADKHHAGIVVLDICGAKDLPKWPNMTYTGWDMDPFVKVSIGNMVAVTTRVVRHSLNPAWDERLFFHMHEDDLSLPIQLTVFDRDKLTSDDYVGEAEINIATLVEMAAQKDPNTGLYPEDLPTMREFELPLVSAKKSGRARNTNPTITFRANFRPSGSLRQARQ